jgi:nucleotide-binding universal stress UspA family protein
VSRTVALLVGAAVWVSVGVIIAVVMARRGHSAFTWLVLGCSLGPLAIPMAIHARDDEAVSPRRIAVGAPGSSGGPVNVLVGIDGSDEARGALRSVVQLLGPRLGRLTLASVIDFDAARTEAPLYERDRAVAELEACAQLARDAGCPSPETVLLAGAPSEALVHHARERADELLVIGTRGRGASKLILGSVAARLARHADLPVLLVSGTTAHEAALTTAASKERGTGA